MFRILTFSNYEVRSNVLLDIKLGWDERLETSRLKQLAIGMYKVYNNLSPSDLYQYSKCSCL